VEPSWRTKVERAQHHLGDFVERIAPLRERRAYPVSEKLETHEQERVYIARIDIPEPTDPLLPIIAGDLMFNLRSALDHLAVALVREPSERTAFPIFTDDLEARDPITGKYLHRSARKRWKAMTKGFPERAMPTIERAQPYRHLREGRDPQYASLALLRVLQNADKHKRLMLIVSGLQSPIIWYNVAPGRKNRARLPRVAEDRRLGPGTPVGRSRDPLPPHMNMEVEGTLDILIRDRAQMPEPVQSRPLYSCPDIFASMIRDIVGLIERLEQYAVHAAGE
jgi:hypothetical protein